MRKLAIIFAIIVVTACVGLFGILPGQLEKRMNKVLVLPPYIVSDEAKRLHEQLLVADMHADSLLWGRNLLEKGSRGHVDVPRLIEGGVGLQAFTIVSKSPRGLNIESNDDTTDNITLAAVINLWPLKAWISLKERALYQASMLHRYAAGSAGKLTVIENKHDLEGYLARRRSDRQITAGFLGIEGAQVLEGRPENVQAMFDAGFRMMSPSHFFDSEIGGSAHGIHKGGLTAAGREVIKRMEERKMLVDVAHASAQTIDDVLGMVKRPVVVSHTGVRGTCDNQRNLSDDQLRRIAATGGVIGIGYWETAVCGTTPVAIAKAIRHAVQVAGIDHVGLGSDFDGAVVEQFDTTGVVLVTQALLQEGFTADEIRKVMGENLLRLLRESLPD